MFECQILEFLALMGIKRSGRIYDRSKDALELGGLDKKKISILRRRERLREEGRTLDSLYCFSLKLRKRPHFGE